VSVKIDVYEVGSLREAIRELRREVGSAYKRQWSKTKPGGYEKRSQRRRCAELLRSTNRRRFYNVHRWRSVGRNPTRSSHYLGLRSLFSRGKSERRRKPPKKPRYIPADHEEVD
jgi:hypothetical protein